MERLSNRAIDIVNELHTERLDYQSEYLPLIDALNKLAAYEDTWLTPEICANYKKFEDEAISKGVTFNRIVELMEAEKDGRLLALPCRAGDTVYEVCNNTDACNDCPFYCCGFGDAWCEKIKDIELRDHPHIAEKPLCEKQFMEVAEHTPDISWIFHHRRDFGKTVFLNREEAEMALEGGEAK